MVKSTYGQFHVIPVEQGRGVFRGSGEVSRVSRKEVCNHGRVVGISDASVDGKLLLRGVGKNYSFALHGVHSPIRRLKGMVGPLFANKSACSLPDRLGPDFSQRSVVTSSKS